MRFFLSYIGGFVWWLFIKFTKTNLEKEQSDENLPRNIFILLITILVITFVSVKPF
jgi:hypothetical protein